MTNNTIYLFWVAIFAFIITVIWKKSQEKLPEEKRYELSPFAVFFSILLTIGVAFLFDKIWSDLKNLTKTELEALFLQGLFTIPLLTLALIFYSTLYKKGKQYAAMLLPYFIASSLEFIAFLFNAGDYALENLGKFGIYVILIIIVVFLSIITFFVQQKWEENKHAKESKKTEVM